MSTSFCQQSFQVSFLFLQSLNLRILVLQLFNISFEVIYNSTEICLLCIILLTNLPPVFSLLRKKSSFSFSLSFPTSNRPLFSLPLSLKLGLIIF
ncbi:hypothetical protein HanIR_Chr08g0361641 [Helianthus annuus]|nr:hypothetical protein HanIR_Chr08g0361641 [Helianthus annuus]